MLMIRRPGSYTNDIATIDLGRVCHWPLDHWHAEANKVCAVVSLLYTLNLLSLQRWRGGDTGKAFGLAISRSQVQILLEATLRNNVRQVVYTYVPLSPSSIAWYRPNGGDAVRLGR